MKKRMLISLLAVCLIFTMIGNPIMAKDNDATQNNGKPFEELWDALNALQQQVSAAISAIQQQIADLQNQINNIQLTPGPQGPQGPQGIQGVQGPVGPQGEVGPAGPQGEKGDTGATGAQGTQGPQGEKGDTGTTGAQGTQGPQGEKGDTGATGAQGAQGPQGEKGDTGATGAQGAQGPQGEKGDTGATGAQGAQGPQGEKGDTGATGAQGAQGPQGEIGPLGPQGATGATGATGTQGSIGPIGPQGPQGPQGEQGIPGAGYLFLNHPKVVSLSAPPSVPAGLKLTGGPNYPGLFYEGTTYWAFSFTDNRVAFAVIGFDASGNIIQRLDISGDRYISSVTVDTTARTTTFNGQYNSYTAIPYTGQQGPQGETGPAGPQGATGTTGAQGPAGPQGATGTTGAQGATGSTGATGATGPIGPIGPVYVPPNGMKVGAGLYEVHSRVLWDIGWLNDTAKEGGYFIYRAGSSQKKYFSMGTNQTFFLSPLKGYGIPEVQAGATRKVRLYVVYSHRMDRVYGSPQIPVIEIGDVRFELPRINGGWDNVGANWSNYRTYAEYSHIGHTSMGMYFDGQCSPTTEPIGVVERIEAYFYDEFPQ